MILIDVISCLLQLEAEGMIIPYNLMSVWQVQIQETTIWSSPSRQHVSEKNSQDIQRANIHVWHC